MKYIIVLIVTMVVLISSATAPGQTNRAPQRPQEQRPSSTEASPPQGEVETLKIDTNLVTVPVIASSHTGNYIADLKREEFKLFEDGVGQEIAFFASVSVPFHVVLLLDTSDSTQEKLGQIQQAAIAFLNQLGPQDRVKVVSFDGDLHDWNDFTNNKALLRDSINKAQSGHNTRVYDAMQYALDALRPIQQRRAVVIFTDGVDWHSETSTFESTTHDLDELGVIVYPIRFDTRVETERLARKQEAESNGVDLPTSSVIRQPPNGTTPPTFPSEETVPTKGTPRGTLPLPLPSVIFGRTTRPPDTSPTDPFPDSMPRRGTRTVPDPSSTSGPSTSPGGSRQHDVLSSMLDNLYLLADSYLKTISERSGGQLYRADTVAALPQVFAAIAAELRTQYLLGYYPTNQDHDGAYRKIQVKTTRKDISIRARPGYRVKTD